MGTFPKSGFQGQLYVAGQTHSCPQNTVLGNVPAQMEEAMFGSRVKLDKDLLKKIKMYAKLAGYSSPQEFITHALEKEIAQLEEADSEDEIKKKLQGLGYIS